MEGLEYVIKDCLGEGGPSLSRNVAAISVAAPASNPVVTDQTGTPLSLLAEFKNEPDAMFIMDESGLVEINDIHIEACKTGICSSVSSKGCTYWGKLLHILRKNQAIARECWSFAEQSDWIPYLLTGGWYAGSITRNKAAAGFRALWSKSNGRVPAGFLSAIDPLFKSHLAKSYAPPVSSDRLAGFLSTSWVERLGLAMSVKVGVGCVDTCAGAVAAGIAPDWLTEITNGSLGSVVITLSQNLKTGIVAADNIVPGMTGMEITGSTENLLKCGVPIEGILVAGPGANARGRELMELSCSHGLKVHVREDELIIAKGAANFAAVVAGIHPDISSAMMAMHQKPAIFI